MIIMIYTYNNLTIYYIRMYLANDRRMERINNVESNFIKS